MCVVQTGHLLIVDVDEKPAAHPAAMIRRQRIESDFRDKIAVHFHKRRRCVEGRAGIDFGSRRSREFQRIAFDLVFPRALRIEAIPPAAGQFALGRLFGKFGDGLWLLSFRRLVGRETCAGEQDERDGFHGMSS